MVKYDYELEFRIIKDGKLCVKERLSYHELLELTASYCDARVAGKHVLVRLVYKAIMGVAKEYLDDLLFWLFERIKK